MDQGGTSPAIGSIDTNAAIDAPPGLGAGVLVEYASGGHWHVRTVCDTTTTGEACAYEVRAQALGSPVTSLTGEALETGDSASYADADTAVLLSSTSTDDDGMRFETVPGVVVTFSSFLGGVRYADDISWITAGAVASPDLRGNPVSLTPTEP